MNDAVKKLTQMVKIYGSQKIVAGKLGITPAYLNDILHEHSGVSNTIAHKLGFRWMLIADDPALEAYLHKFVKAPADGAIIPVMDAPTTTNVDQDSHDWKEG